MRWVVLLPDFASLHNHLHSLHASDNNGQLLEHITNELHALPVPLGPDSPFHFLIWVKPMPSSLGKGRSHKGSSLDYIVDEEKMWNPTLQLSFD